MLRQGCDSSDNIGLGFFCFLFSLGFTPCNAKQPLRGTELKEKEAQKKLKHIRNLFKKSLQLKSDC